MRVIVMYDLDYCIRLLPIIHKIATGGHSRWPHEWVPTLHNSLRILFRTIMCMGTERFYGKNSQLHKIY